jgi:hypothetical protein
MTAAVLTINHPGDMTKHGRKLIANWLKQQADDFQEHGKEYGPKRIVMRYHTAPVVTNTEVIVKKST